jgi:fructose-1,6-bisphosphatase/inositol monophosphatase family enzyme
MAIRKFKSFGKAVVALGSVALANAAMAAGSIDISADTAAAKTDIATAGGLIVGVVVAVAAISWIRRVIK